MQPNQPEQPQDPKRYDFFLNPPTQPKQKKLPNVPGVRDPFLKKIILLVGGGVALIVVVLILASVIFGNKSSTTNLVSLVQQQNELIRVAGEATTSATQQTTKSLAVSAQLSLTTSQQELLVYMQKHNQKVSSQTLSLTKSATTDTQLTNAKAASNFDSAFVQIIQQQLTAYTQAIKQDFTATANQDLRTLLNTEYNAGSLLLTQANSATQSQ